MFKMLQGPFYVLRPQFAWKIVKKIGLFYGPVSFNDFSKFMITIYLGKLSVNSFGKSNDMSDKDVLKSKHHQ